MTNVHNGLDLKNMSDPILKQIYAIYKAEHLMNEQIKKYKTTETKILKNIAI